MSSVIENPEIQKLVGEIEAYLEATNTSETAFGKDAVNDPNLIKGLRSGREPRWSTIQRIRNKLGGAS